ncbi:MAG: hypothetical protein WA950_13910 [Shinella sp.]|uniref:hypothetical protein n=1 Tax=Shinella sp. TaxID=1870904 RepID=UPI003C730A0A
MRKSHERNAAVILAAFLLAGCTVHPLPDDVTSNTVAIVQKIRCEARDAVLAGLRDALMKKGTGTDKAFVAEAQLSSLLDEKDPPRLSSDLRKYLDTYSGGAIGYDFSFDITVHKDNSLGINLFNPFSNGKRTFDIGAGITRQNQGARSFQIVDTFAELAQLSAEKDGENPCANLEADNSLYPLTGKIGLEEVVGTFLELNDMAGIERKGLGDKTTTFTDTIEFQTILSGRVNPKIELLPVKHGLGIADASMTNTVKRTDKHKVTIALQLESQQAVIAGAKKPVEIKPSTGVLKTLKDQKQLEKITPLQDFLRDIQ